MGNRQPSEHRPEDPPRGRRHFGTVPNRLRRRTPEAEHDGTDPPQPGDAEAPTETPAAQTRISATAPRQMSNPLQPKTVRERPKLTETTFTPEPTGNTTTPEEADPVQPFTRRPTATLRLKSKNYLAKVKTNNSAQEDNTRTADQEERCYDPNDPTLTLVDGEDDMDFELNEYKSLRAKMSCGHTVTPTSLMDWCHVLIDKGESRFVCGQPGCDAEWPCEEVYKKALMTPEEIDYFDRKLFNRAKDYLGVKTCPGCKSLVVRKDLNDLRVICTVCTNDKARYFQFCWQCLKEWKRPSPHSDRCAEPGCVSVSLEILRRCPEIIFEDVRNVTGCPSVRACPTCGLLIEHNKKKCKNIVCRRCKVKFCFVCLKLAEECFDSNPGQDQHYTACVSGVAPRQTSIPVWKKGN